MSVASGPGEIFINHNARMHIDGVLTYEQTKDNYWFIDSGLILAGIPYCALLEYAIAEQLKFLTLDANSKKVKTLLTSCGSIKLSKLALAFGGATIFYWFARR
ncbi:unnamed protein product [Rotaria magnacalcarata]|uniref:Uncharacterized protein n=2 Tax=Rotaria magnacalcarata TaxID=392030 RepID=A0A819QPY8_9BILA|nr:unnamed protein product [Rotaria magnacalcarata]CAF2125009.1 unnamed protein product [Rotaria magnacalcarata]CAF2148253.1 unnamed protein product [Rotaria magnacalcarata]CAF4028708.1 unnamed protein product [Rotaria magnacalcarata]CAF4116912.1 unnamed protein product [Rotaria magnacalcarata]